MLRATIVGTELVQLLAIHTALVALANDGATDLKIVNLKNRLYSDDADLAGYRDMNYALCFNGVTCELQIMLQVVDSVQLMGFHLSRVKQRLLANALAFDVQEFADIKQGSHKSYEYCRSLGMSTGLVGIGGLRAT